MITAVRRTAIVGGVLIATMAMSAPHALADDLSDVLERANTSTYTATRLTVSVWGGQSQIIKERVEHADGAEMVRVDETWSMVGNGRTISMGDSPTGLAFMTTSTPIETSRYQLGDTTPISHMRRDCTLVPVYEGESIRAHLIVDRLTGAPLISYLYDGDGDVFRQISLSSFSPHRTYEWSGDPSDVPVEIVMHTDDVAVPEEVAGYHLVDVFPGPGDSQQGYYSDGFFEFSLFTVPSSVSLGGFDDSMTFVADSGLYDMVPSAKDVRLQWTSPDSQYVLVGDLPPDHLNEVLAELPEPDTATMLKRLWRKLFG